MHRARSVLPAALATLAISIVACNAITGSAAYSEGTRCTGPTCGKCALGEIVNPITGDCVPCSDGEHACGTKCCTLGHACQDPSTGACAPCGTDETACGTACCVSGQVCLEATQSKCAQDCGSGTRCGKTCCTATQTCDLATNACTSCGRASQECGKLCCADGESCLDKTTQACGTAFGLAKQSCGGGLVCPVPDGKGGTEMADCCESITVPGDTFVMGDDEWYWYMVPSYTATVSAYALDRFEVTVGRFRPFVQAYSDLMKNGGLPPGAGANAHVPGPTKTGWRTEWNQLLPQSAEALSIQLSASNFTASPGLHDVEPVWGLTWFEAFAFCAWDGGRLPTEAEWEMAAANGSSESLHPWGNDDPTEELAVFSPESCFLSPPSGACLLAPAAVGSKPAGANALGHRDLGGNVAEWTLDDYLDYPKDCAPSCTNYTRTGISPNRALRGGAYDTRPYGLRAAFRWGEVADSVHGGIGVRCARSP